MLTSNFCELKNFFLKDRILTRNSDTSYFTPADYFDPDPSKNPIKFKFYIGNFLTNASDNRIPELVRPIIKRIRHFSHNMIDPNPWLKPTHTQHTIVIHT